jgi:predicted RNA-binding protein Jag
MFGSKQPSSIDKFVTAVTSSEAAPWEIDLHQVPKKKWEIQMANRYTKGFTCFAAALAFVMFSTAASVAEDAPQIKMDTQFLDMLSTFQKKAAEASEAIIQNKKDASKNADQSTDQAQNFLESLSNFQKKAFGTTDPGNQNTR